MGWGVGDDQWGGGWGWEMWHTVTNLSESGMTGDLQIEPGWLSEHYTNLLL